MDAPLLQLEGITVRDGERTVLDDVDLNVAAGEIVGVCFAQAHGGRTTLLHVAAGLREPDAGSVRLNGRRLSGEMSVPPYPVMGMVFRDDGGLFPNLTIEENVGLPLHYHGEEDADERCREAMESMGIAAAADHFPWELTRERMRLAALARALVYRPRIVLIDDFYAGADESAFERSREAILRANEAHGTAFLLVVEPELQWDVLRRETIDRGHLVE
jgi:ABC-type transporter Mla maintaining outer membrane lipid asymmetry ATPase subunit MlaF